MKKQLLYIIDNINYESGVQKVTSYQIENLIPLYDISILSLEQPDSNTLKAFSGVNFLKFNCLKYFDCLNTPFVSVLKSDQFSIKQKVLKIIYAILTKINLQDNFVNLLLYKNLYDGLNKYDIVCVVSEASKLRKIVSKLDNPKKIQWIHTDYARWYNYSSWIRAITKNDFKIYQSFDHIVCLSEKNKKDFIRLYPNLKEKVIAIRNLIPTEEIIQKSFEACSIKVNPDEFNIVTVGRLSEEKAFSRILKICRQLHSEGYPFKWYIVGDGILRNHLKYLIYQYDLTNIVYMVGKLENPYSLMRQCDLFALLSNYEGMPVTIDEALVLSIPVIATDVGAISEQIADKKTGLLIPNSEQAIYSILRDLLRNKEILFNLKKNTIMYSVPNQEILKNIIKIF